MAIKLWIGHLYLIPSTVISSTRPSAALNPSPIKWPLLKPFPNTKIQNLNIPSPNLSFTKENLPNLILHRLIWNSDWNISPGRRTRKTVGGLYLLSLRSLNSHRRRDLRSRFCDVLWSWSFKMSNAATSWWGLGSDMLKTMGRRFSSRRSGLLFFFC